jgi:hypothetical protein
MGGGAGGMGAGAILGGIGAGLSNGNKYLQIRSRDWRFDVPKKEAPASKAPIEAPTVPAQGPSAAESKSETLDSASPSALSEPDAPTDAPAEPK